MRENVFVHKHFYSFVFIKEYLYDSYSCKIAKASMNVRKMYVQYLKNMYIQYLKNSTSNIKILGNSI